MRMLEMDPRNGERVFLKRVGLAVYLLLAFQRKRRGLLVFSFLP
jgi:hypothetical protein